MNKKLSGIRCVLAARFIASAYWVIGLFWFTAVVFTVSPVAVATPFVPNDPAQIIERLPFKPGDASVRELREQRAALTREPDNIKLAVQAARDYMTRGRAEGDPRFFGYAEGALGPWWNLPNPPEDVLLLRAKLHQVNHDFAAALTDLDLLLKSDPNNLNAWLTRAIIFQVQGKYAEAQKNCAPLLQIPSLKLTGLSCVSSVASFNGAAQASYDALYKGLEGRADITPEDRQWALTILADIAARTGQTAVAERHFKDALMLGPDIWLLGAYANFLLDQGRPTEVIELLKDETSVDNLLLLLTLAEQAVNAPALAKHVLMLRERFAASRLRNDMRHRREEARFTLHILHEPREALKLAQENWAVQREPEDARVLLEAALAAEDIKAAQPVLKFLTESGLEDVHLDGLVKQVKAQPV
ncbi:MAG: hypothetical protein ABIQ54_02795 [Gammaproteobacteria bacterium]